MLYINRCIFHIYIYIYNINGEKRRYENPSITYQFRSGDSTKLAQTDFDFQNSVDFLIVVKRLWEHDLCKTLSKILSSYIKYDILLAVVQNSQDWHVAWQVPCRRRPESISRRGARRWTLRRFVQSLRFGDINRHWGRKWYKDPLSCSRKSWSVMLIKS